MTLEFENELGEIRSYVSKPRQTNRDISPLVTGDTSPFFNLTGGSGDWRASLFNYPSPGPTVSLLDLVNTKPVVVSFYCPCWGRYASPYLDSLVKLNESLQELGVELVVLSNESPKALRRQGKDLNFLFAHDTDLQVSRQFGVYNEDSPVWDRVSGISDEAFIPALYVIDQDRRIVYHHLDENFDSPLDLEAIVDQVQSLRTVTPAFINEPEEALNPYSRSFFALWLLSMLAVAGSQLINF
ncbi:peroxiredoxin family protein [Spirosoma soli]|uniref:Peroxiredoxin family protein n=1 Tax=Spirosoma soli TaxID=1770529 RepID=A0ABW5M4Y4_9BACT